MAKAQVRRVELPNVPSIRLLTTGQPIVPAAEKGQINRITVEHGTPGNQNYVSHVIWEENAVVEGVNPFQGNFIFNLVAGALGSGRGARPTAFASWAVQVQEEFKAHAMFKPLMKYNAIVDYTKGNTMVYPVTDMLTLCQIKRENVLNSIERFPPDTKATVQRKKAPKSVEVSLSL